MYALILLSGCEGRDVWKDQLTEAIKDADRLVVTGPDYEDPERRPSDPGIVLFDVTRSGIGKEFASNFSFDPGESGSHCFCFSGVYATFYTGETEVATVEFIFSHTWRWDGWWNPQDDATLNENVPDDVAIWFLENGSDFYAKIIQGEGERREKVLTRREEFFSHFPNPVFKYWNPDKSVLGQLKGVLDRDIDKKKYTKILEVYDDPSEAVYNVCLALGDDDPVWCPWCTDDEVLWFSTFSVGARAVSDQTWERAIELIAEDKDAMIGCAAFYFGLNLARDLPGVDDTDWLVTLATAVLTGSDERSANLSLILDKFAEVYNPAIEGYLLGCLDGKGIREVDPADLQDHWWSLRAEIALFLGTRKVYAAENKIRSLCAEAKRAADVRAYEVALALLGDPDALAPEHFMTGMEFGEAEEAIRRFDGSSGLDVLVEVLNSDNGRRDMIHRKQMIIELLQEITGQVWCDAEWTTKVDVEVIPEINLWWANNGEAFVESRRKVVGVGN